MFAHDMYECAIVRVQCEARGIRIRSPMCLEWPEFPCNCRAVGSTFRTKACTRGGACMYKDKCAYAHSKEEQAYWKRHVDTGRRRLAVFVRLAEGVSVC